MAGDDHVEVGSSLRSAAAFGFHEVLLEDRGAGWFGGSPAVRREARAAARRHKNPLRVHRATLDIAARYAEIVLVTPSGPGGPLQQENLTRGSRQLVIIGTSPREIDAGAITRARIATLGLEPATSAPLRLIASIILAEIARQTQPGLLILYHRTGAQTRLPDEQYLNEVRQGWEGKVVVGHDLEMY